MWKKIHMSRTNGKNRQHKDTHQKTTPSFEANMKKKRVFWVLLFLYSLAEYNHSMTPFHHFVYSFLGLQRSSSPERRRLTKGLVIFSLRKIVWQEEILGAFWIYNTGIQLICEIGTIRLNHIKLPFFQGQQLLNEHQQFHMVQPNILVE